MDFLESMTIEQLVSLNQDIQKVLKEKRKSRKLSEEKIGDKIKIVTEYNNDGKPIARFLKIRQRYVPDTFITILDSDPEKFIKEMMNFSNDVCKATRRVGSLSLEWNKKEN